MFAPSVHPDFLSSFLALTNFMRLSLMKAAHASVGGAPCRKSGAVGRKRRAKPHNRSWPKSERQYHGMKALEKYRFRPRYAGANLGHPSCF